MFSALPCAGGQALAGPGCAGGFACAGGAPFRLGAVCRADRSVLKRRTGWFWCPAPQGASVRRGVRGRLRGDSPPATAGRCPHDCVPTPPTSLAPGIRHTVCGDTPAPLPPAPSRPAARRVLRSKPQRTATRQDGRRGRSGGVPAGDENRTRQERGRRGGSSPEETPRGRPRPRRQPGATARTTPQRCGAPNPARPALEDGTSNPAPGAPHGTGPAGQTQPVRRLRTEPLHRSGGTLRGGAGVREARRRRRSRPAGSASRSRRARRRR
jgi:hypothetical protein